MCEKHARLLEEYLPVITLDQIYIIRRISKRKGRWLLENGVIPCVDTGLKTNRFRVKMTDVVAFLERRDSGGVAILSGIFSNRRAYQKETPPIVDERRL